VLERLVPVEREVGPVPDGTWFLAPGCCPTARWTTASPAWCCHFIDITERKQAEEVRLWLSAVVTSVNDAIISFALDQTILSWNAGAERLFGYTAQEAIGQPLALLMPRFHRRATSTAGTDDLLASGGRRQSINQAGSAAAPQGRQRWCTCRSAPRPSATTAASHPGGTAIARDVTASRAAAEALRQSEERLRLIVESAREYAIFSIDLDRRVTSWNSGAERLLGYTAPRCWAPAATSSSPRTTASPARPRRRRARRWPTAAPRDDRIHVRKDGSQFWAEGVPC
jgi:two-component system CheB/CheR fusion protein